MGEENTKRPEKKKHYGVLLGLTLGSWLVIAGMIWKVDPESIKNILIPNIYLPMLLMIFFGVFFLLSILMLSAKMALRWTLGVVVFLLLRILGLGNILNGVLILGLLISFEFYLHERSV
jgi:hypothetical protein